MLQVLTHSGLIGLWNRKEKSAEQELWSPLPWYSYLTAVPGDPDFFSYPIWTLCYHVHQPNTSQWQRIKGSIDEADSRPHPTLQKRVVKNQELWGQKCKTNREGFGDKRQNYGMKVWVRMHLACQLRGRTFHSMVSVLAGECDLLWAWAFLLWDNSETTLQLQGGLTI